MQIKSKKRVEEFGEVFTNMREVNNMLDLVKQEAERIDSRFLEPACGNGLFLKEILNRKLKVVASRYKSSQFDYEKYSILAVMSIYGIDILEDNVNECRGNLLDLYISKYKELFKSRIDDNVISSVKKVLSLNILVGDALTLKKPASDEYIFFPEWSLLNGTMVKRRDFTFSELLFNAPSDEFTLFSDLHEEVFIPRPIKEHQVANIRRLDYEDC